VDTIRDEKITHRKGKIKILHVFEEMDGLLVFLVARKSKEKYTAFL
jgi:hypothetical protein